MLDVDHPGGHTASRVVVAWVDETTLPPSVATAPAGEGESPEPKASHGCAFTAGLVCLMFVYLASCSASPTGPAGRSVYAMTVGPIVLSLSFLAAILGLYGLNAIAADSLRGRANAEIWVLIVLIGWVVASCVVPVAI